MNQPLVHSICLFCGSWRMGASHLYTCDRIDCRLLKAAPFHQMSWAIQEKMFIAAAACDPQARGAYELA